MLRKIVRLISIVFLLVGILPFPVQAAHQQPIITTIAGGGVGDDALALNVSLREPQGVTVDKLGNLYIADTSQNRIRKVDSQTGIITTFAGNGTPGYSGDGGLATSASLWFPRSPVIDTNSNLYFADALNNRIRKIDTSGIITTVAGNGTQGYSGDGGSATDASINVWQGGQLALDDNGNLYFSTYGGIRKIDTSGIISTIYAGGDFVGDITIDGVGNLYFGNSYEWPTIIYKIDTTGTVTTFMEGIYPGSLAADRDGNLYIASWNTIKKIDKDKNISTIVENFSEAGNFYGFNHLWVQGNELYMTDNLHVHKVDSNGVITTVAGNGKYYSGEGGLAINADLGDASDITVDAFGNIFIASDCSNVVFKIDTAGILTTYAGVGLEWVWGYAGDGGPATEASLDWPHSVAVDSKGNVYFLEPGNRVIRKVDTNGIISTFAGGGTSTADGIPATEAALSRYPEIFETIVVDSNDNIYFTDGDRIRKIDLNGVITTVAGGGTSTVEGVPATDFDLGYPEGIAIDHSGVIYTTGRLHTTGRYGIYKIGTDGVITIFAGNGTSTTEGIPAIEAAIYPYRLAFDIYGDLYVVDWVAGSYSIRKIDRNGTITTVIEPVYTQGYTGLTFDKYNNLYFIDFDLAYLIRKAIFPPDIIWLPPLRGTESTGKLYDMGSAANLPIKFRLVGNYNQFVENPTVKVEVWQIKDSSGNPLEPTKKAELSPAIFTDANGQKYYQANLKTKELNLPGGTYIIKILYEGFEFLQEVYMDFRYSG